MLEETERAVRGEPSNQPDARVVQPYLAHKLARVLNAGLTLTAADGAVDVVAG